MSRKGLIVAGILVWSVGTVLSGWAPNLVSLLLFRILVGLGEASYGSVSPGWIADLYSPARRNLRISIFYIGDPGGFGPRLPRRRHHGGALGLALGVLPLGRRAGAPPGARACLPCGSPSAARAKPRSPRGTGSATARIGSRPSPGTPLMRRRRWCALILGCSRLRPSGLSSRVVAATSAQRTSPWADSASGSAYLPQRRAHGLGLEQAGPLLRPGWLVVTGLLRRPCSAAAPRPPLAAAESGWLRARPWP